MQIQLIVNKLEPVATNFETIHEVYSLRKYVVIPILIGELTYAILNIGFYNIGMRTHQEGVMFFTEIAVFRLFTLLVLPYVIMKYYGMDLLYHIHISKRSWLILTGFTCFMALFFVSSKQIAIYQITINRSGFGVISFSSVVQSAFFKNYCFAE